MRSCTYVHPGEHLSCLGCHEHKWKAPAGRGGLPKAFRRAPSEIAPEPEGSLPFSFASLVQRVLEAKCGDCHAHRQVKPHLAAGPSPSANASAAIYTSLERYAFYFHGQGSALGLCCSSLTDRAGMLARRALPARPIPSSKIGIQFCTDP